MMTITTKFDRPYLELNPPARRQWRDRDEPVRAVNVLHTAQSGTDTAGADPKAENVANFIRNRTGPGSYHLLGDADSALLLIDLDKAAYGDGTGSNDWAVQISLAMNAADWPNLTTARRDQFIDSAVTMSLHRARWDLEHGRTPPAPVRLTRVESRKPDASGFVAHGDRDPTRRSDPGEFFPWPEFLERYANGLEELTDEFGPVEAPFIVQRTYDLQKSLAALGYDIAIDGDIGPQTTDLAATAVDDLAAMAQLLTDHKSRLIAAIDQASKIVADLSET